MFDFISSIYVWPVLIIISLILYHLFIKTATPSDGKITIKIEDDIDAVQKEELFQKINNQTLIQRSTMIFKEMIKERPSILTYLFSSMFFGIIGFSGFNYWQGVHTPWTSILALIIQFSIYRLITLWSLPKKDVDKSEIPAS